MTRRHSRGALHAIACIAASLALAGCSTLSHHVPAVPLERGSTRMTLSLTMPTARQALPSMQASLHVGVSDRDLVSLGIYYVLPASLGYARYFPLGANWGRVQVHALNPFVSGFESYDPVIELEAAYGSERGAFSQSVRLGMAWMGPRPITPRWLEERAFGIVPVIGFGARLSRVSAEATFRPWSTRYFAAQIRSTDRHAGGTLLVIDRSEIASLVVLDSAHGCLDALVMNDGTTYQFIPATSPRRFGYRHGIAEPFDIRRFPASPGHAFYFIDPNDSARAATMTEHGWRFDSPVELDLCALSRELERSGRINIVDDGSLDAAAVVRVGPGWEDVTSSVGVIIGEIDE